tara:strand:+ start:109 stop:285 length:177 start_codon:yes stop_codon:yes gene_type:complete
MDKITPIIGIFALIILVVMNIDVFFNNGDIFGIKNRFVAPGLMLLVIFLLIKNFFYDE